VPQVLLFNLLPPPGPPQPDEPGEAWQPAPAALEVQGAVVDAIEQVRLNAGTKKSLYKCMKQT